VRTAKSSGAGFDFALEIGVQPMVCICSMPYAGSSSIPDLPRHGPRGAPLARGAGSRHSRRLPPRRRQVAEAVDRLEARIREEDADVKHIHPEAEALRRAGHAGERPAM
jgi:hypothetical protein